MAATGESPYRRYRQTKHFSSLDGLRALAVVGTVWQHTAVGTGFLAIGWLGVHLFFAISGFLITTLLLREWEAHGRLDLKAFYARRMLRIFPAYYLTVAIYCLLAVTLQSQTPSAQRYLELLPAFMTYTANWFYTPLPGVTLFVHGWSLSTEEQFYLLWPPLLLLALSAGGRLFWAASAVACLVIIDFGGPYMLGHSLAGTALASLSLPICAGALIAITLHSERGFRALSTLLGSRVASPVVVSLILMASAEGARIELLQVGLVALVTACVIREDHALRPILAWRPVSFLGRISYGVYLYHLIVVLVLALLGAGRLPSVLFAALTLLVTTWLASVSYVFYESPFLRMKTRYDRSASAAPPLQSDAPVGGARYEGSGP